MPKVAVVPEALSSGPHQGVQERGLDTRRRKRLRLCLKTLQPAGGLKTATLDDCGVQQWLRLKHALPVHERVEHPGTLNRESDRSDTAKVHQGTCETVQFIGENSNALPICTFLWKVQERFPQRPPNPEFSTWSVMNSSNALMNSSRCLARNSKYSLFVRTSIFPPGSVSAFAAKVVHHR